MMKQIIPLLLLGSAAATRLGTSNVGVEEIGDQIEFFPEEIPDREELLANARKLQAKEYAPDLDLVEVRLAVGAGGLVLMLYILISSTPHIISPPTAHRRL